MVVHDEDMLSIEDLEATENAFTGRQTLHYVYVYEDQSITIRPDLVTDPDDLPSLPIPNLDFDDVGPSMAYKQTFLDHKLATERCHYGWQRLGGVRVWNATVKGKEMQ